MSAFLNDVRFIPESRHSARRTACLLSARTSQRVRAKSSYTLKQTSTSEADVAFQTVSSGHSHYYSGWKPFDLNTGAAVVPLRNWMSDFAASGALVLAPIPAVKTVILANSPGSGPTNCAPATGTISEACATPISASPLATTSAAWAPGTRMVLDFNCSAIPSRSTTPAK
jgi:hypothetical protein